MPDSETSPVKDPRNIAIVVLVAVVVSLVLYTVLSERRAGSNEKPAAAADDSKARSPRGGDDDPYLKGAVKNTIVKKYLEVQTCYKEFLNKNPKVTDGRVSIDWTIKPDGSVKSPELVGSQLGDETLHNCMIEKVKNWNFPEPPEGTNRYVEHSFNFKKEPEEGPASIKSKKP